MAVKKEQLDLNSEAAGRRPIELITENGFSIIREADIGAADVPPPGTYTFLVGTPNDYELEITVELDQGFRNEVRRLSGGRLSRESSYWICCAERHLATYLWDEDDCPPNAALKVGELTPEDVNLAHRWGKDS